MYTPQTSRHFTRHINQKTGMEFYVLSTHIAPVQQGFYFVNSGFSDDGRYLYFYCAYPPTKGHTLGVVDFAHDEVYALPDTGGSGWMIDPKTGNVLFGASEGIFCRTPHPQDKPELILPMPKYLKEKGASHCGTHLTYTPDRSELIADIQTRAGSYIGSFNLITKEFTEWYHTEPGIPYNHAQCCPTNPDLCMCAHEYSFSAEKNCSVPPALVDGIYPRLQLIHRDGTREMRAPLENYATHEWWSADGTAIYYCNNSNDTYSSETSGGGNGKHLIARDRLGDNKPELICDIPIEGGVGTWHGHSTADDKYFIIDGSLPSYNSSWWRGCASTVRFWNNETKKLIDLVSYNPPVNGWTPDNQCPYHIDPHPRFVLNDTFITFTTTVCGRVDVAIAPVQQLIDATK